MNGQPQSENKSIAAPPLLKATGIQKSFLGNLVLDRVNLELYPGEVHGLVGENGAGKSTLMKIFAGVYQADSGEFTLDGKAVRYTHPLQASNAGIVTVFQEFNLLSERNVAENIFLGREPLRYGFVSKRTMHQEAARLLAELGVESIPTTARVGSLSIAEQQIVEIAKALSYDARIISMDEPTAALSDKEVELLYAIVERLKARGVAILYVSHRIKELFDLCDRLTILKDGKLVNSGKISDFEVSTLVSQMVGRSIDTFFPERLENTPGGSAPVRLELEAAGNAYLNEIQFQLKAGEILGVAGLQGSGRTELAEAIFGLSPFTRGTLKLDGKPISIRSPRQAIKEGIALISEDRKQQGLGLNQSIADNLLMVVHGVFSFRTGRVKNRVPELLSELEVNTREAKREVQYLSGGNQQKVVLGKWLNATKIQNSKAAELSEQIASWSNANGPRVVILDEPTRGIDVGAKVAVYRQIRKLAQSGVAVLLISSELPEIIGMSDRILVLHDGQLSAEFAEPSNEEKIMAAATGQLSVIGAGD